VPSLPTIVKVVVAAESSIGAVTSTCDAAIELMPNVIDPPLASVVVVAVTLGSELAVVNTFHAFAAESSVACVARDAYEALSVWRAVSRVLSVVTCACRASFGADSASISAATSAEVLRPLMMPEIVDAPAEFVPVVTELTVDTAPTP
jgi:hypothetical protein